jgi:hypothetical protein
MDVFRPENYGAAANGITDDTEAINAAYAALKAAGGGILQLDNTYGFGVLRNPDATPRQFWMNQYPMRIGLLIDSDDVVIAGNGTLKLNTAPTTSTGGVDNYVAIAVGHAAPTVQPYLSMPYCYRTTIHGITIDVSALSDADLTLMGEGSISGAIALCKCDDFVIENVTVNGSWGFTGVITVHVGSEYGIIRRNRVNGRAIAGANNAYTPMATGIWVDGGRFIQIIDNDLSVVRNGISAATNRDNNRDPYNVVIANNRVTNFNGTGASVHGRKSTITDNSFRTDRGSTFGVVCFAANAWRCEGNLIQGNSYEFVHPSVRSGIGFDIRSRGGTAPEFNRDHYLAQNTVKNAASFIRLDSSLCKGNVALNNVLVNTGGVQLTNDATLDGNIIQLN